MEDKNRLGCANGRSIDRIYRINKIRRPNYGIPSKVFRNPVNPVRVFLRVSAVKGCGERFKNLHEDDTLTLNNGFDYREQIDNRGSGLTVLAYLSGTYRHSSELEWRMRLRDGGVFVDGRQVGPDAVLDRGQWLVWRRPPWVEPDAPLSYAVLYEDEDLLAVAKALRSSYCPRGWIS